MIENMAVFVCSLLGAAGVMVIISGGQPGLFIFLGRGRGVFYLAESWVTLPVSSTIPRCHASRR